MIDKNNFCIMPWSSITISPTGEFRICCFSGEHVVPRENTAGHLIRKSTKGVPTDSDGKNMNILTYSLADALNSDLHKEIRLSQLNNEKHPSCHICWIRDAAAKKSGVYSNSMRMSRSFVQFPKYDTNHKTVRLENAHLNITNTGKVAKSLVSLDIRFSNLCNMKCIMCSPSYSNLWYEDWIKINNTNKFTLGLKEFSIEGDDKKTTNMPHWYETQKWWDEFDKIKKDLVHIYVTGGEPFLVPAHGKLLDILIENNLAKNITLEYDTNLSVINNKIIDRFAHFKKIELRISCDDTKERYELIRFPGKFQLLVDNLATLRKINSSNIEVQSITTCTGIYSVFAPLRLHNFFGSLGYKINTRLLEYPTEYELTFLSADIKQKILEVYSKTAVPQYVSSLIVGHLTNTLNESDKQISDIQVEAFRKRMNKLDELRGTNWKHVFPEIENLLS